jgi:hypothetical protein
MAQNRPIVADLDFTSVKEDMISYFKSKPEFKDYEFTGSGLNLLLDVLAYNTHYNALTANFLMNEMFLDTAVMRNNVTSLAKSLNYSPRSITSASSFITITIPRLFAESYYVLPAGTLFTTRNGNSSLSFYTLKAYTVQFGQGDTEKTVTVQAYEGAISTQRYIYTTDVIGFPSFEIPDYDIDTSTISVSVNGDKFSRVTPEKEGIVNVTDTSRIFFTEETRNGTQRLLFGNGTIGKALEVGDDILATYLISSGLDGNGISSFDIDSTRNITVNSATISQGGAVAESIREIRTNAPHWFQSQYRAVTENDYSVLLRKKYADIQAISVYGGETVGQPGKVFISIKPKSADTLSVATKDAIINDILSGSNVVTITPILIDPVFVNIVLKSVITYDDNLMTTNPDVLKARAFTMFSNFNTEYIGEFLKSFRVSQLSSEIEKLDDAVVSSNTRLNLRIDITAKNQKLARYGWKYNNRIYHPEAGYKKAQGGVLSTNAFNRVGRTYTSGFDDDGNGNVRLFDLIDNTKVYANERAGLIDYEKGTIDILIEFDPVDTTIQFTVVPDSFDVVAQENSILRISVDASLVETVEKNDTATLKNINLSRSN